MELKEFYLLLSTLLFSIGAFGVLLRKNAIVVCMCIELMLNGVNLALVAFANSFGSIDGQIYVLFIMAIAAAEAGVGLAIIISVYRHYSSVEMDQVRVLKN